jgi:putative ABC transport system substrate-binding protein
MNKVSLMSAAMLLGIWGTTGTAGELETVLVLLPDSSESQMSLVGLEEEIGGELRIKTRVVSDDTTVRDLQRYFKETSPSVVVIDQTTERLYRQFQLSRVGSSGFPATIVLNEESRASVKSGLTNTAALNYGVAGVTCLVNLRSIMKQPLKRVGVIYRGESEAYIRDQKRLAAQEKIELVPRVVSAHASKAELKGVLQGLINDASVDALWVLNDDALLSPDHLKNSWLPVLERNQKPVVVNSPNLVNSNLRFGVFGVFPDHVAVGSQVANMVFDLRERGWNVEKDSFEEALSVRKVLLWSMAKEHLALKVGALAQLDQVIQ